MRVLYYNCSSGICGDMNLGAMIELGADPDALVAELKKLNLDGWSLYYERDIRSGISGTRCDVKLIDSQDDGALEAEPQKQDFGTLSFEQHAAPEHSIVSHDHDHRTFRDIRGMIEASDLKASVKADAVAVFQVLAEAEGAVHDKPIDEVHFHEVGAVDSIVDIVGAAICWDLLGVDAIASSAIELGGGTVKCAHGRMPVPAPATARLLDGCPVTLNATNKEATTPTGAAILVGKKCRFDFRLSGRQVKAATGIGQRKDPKIPNALHVALYETDEASAESTTVWELAANLDDMTPEHVAFLCEKLHEAGAVDVWQTSATFKKGRVGVVVTALAPTNELAAVESAFLKHSSTLGLRRRQWQRTVLERSIESVDTEWGPIRVKLAKDANGVVIRRKPEYEDCKAIAEQQGLSIAEVVEAINGKDRG